MARSTSLGAFYQLRRPIGLVPACSTGVECKQDPRCTNGDPFVSAHGHFVAKAYALIARPCLNYYGSVSIIPPKLGNPHQPWGECGWCHRIAGLPRHDYLVQPTRTMHTIPSPGRRRNPFRTRLPTRLRRIVRCFWHVAIDSGRHGPSVRQTQTLTHTLSSSMDPWACAYRPMWT